MHVKCHLFLFVPLALSEERRKGVSLDVCVTVCVCVLKGGGIQNALRSAGVIAKEGHVNNAWDDGYLKNIPTGNDSPSNEASF